MWSFLQSHENMEISRKFPFGCFIFLVIALSCGTDAGRSCIFGNETGKRDSKGIKQEGPKDKYSCLKQCALDLRCTGASLKTLTSEPECYFSFSDFPNLVVEVGWSYHRATACDRDIGAPPPDPFCIYQTTRGKKDRKGVLQDHTGTYSCLKQCTWDVRCTAANVNAQTGQCLFSFTIDPILESESDWSYHFVLNCPRDVNAAPKTTTTTTQASVYVPERSCFLIETIHTTLLDGVVQSIYLRDPCVKACEENRLCYAVSFSASRTTGKCLFTFDPDPSFKPEIGSSAFVLKYCQRGVVVHQEDDPTISTLYTTTDGKVTVNKTFNTSPSVLHNGIKHHLILLVLISNIAVISFLGS